jgi:MGT family glycosyltransferase
VSTIAFLNIAMHGHINPTLPVVAELVRRGHSVTYHTSPAFSKEIEATGATVCLYPGGDQPFPDPSMPLTMLDGLAHAAVALLPAVLSDLRRVRPDLIVHGAACPWGAVAARELDVPAAALFTTFAFNRYVPSPTRASWELLAAAATRPHNAQSYLRSRWELYRRYDTRGLPLLDLANARQPLNLVFTSRALWLLLQVLTVGVIAAGAALAARRRESGGGIRLGLLLTGGVIFIPWAAYWGLLTV